MALPRRIPKQKKHSDRWRSQAHCSFVRSHECVVPGCGGRPIEVMHIRTGSDASMGRKPSDWFTVSGCKDHHSEQHRLGENSFARKYAINLHQLADEFAAASPKASEIRAIRKERADG